MSSAKTSESYTWTGWSVSNERPFTADGSHATRRCQTACWTDGPSRAEAESCLDQSRVSDRRSVLRLTRFKSIVAPAPVTGSVCSIWDSWVSQKGTCLERFPTRPSLRLFPKEIPLLTVNCFQTIVFQPSYWNLLMFYFCRRSKQTGILSKKHFPHYHFISVSPRLILWMDPAVCAAIVFRQLMIG